MMIEQEREKPFSHQRKIPFGHADMAGIVYTPRFSDYCLEAVEQWLQEVVYIDWYELNKEGVLSVPVLHLALDFKSPLVPGNELSTTVLVSHIGNSSFSLSLKGVKTQGNSRVEVFLANIVLSFLDAKAFKSISIPDGYRRRMLAYKEQFSSHGKKDASQPEMSTA